MRSIASPPVISHVIDPVMASACTMACMSVTSSRDHEEGQGQRDDQRADAEVDHLVAEVDHLVAEEHGCEFPEHRARPVVSRGSRSRDLAVDAEAASEHGGPEHMVVTGHDDASVAGLGPLHARLAESQVLLGGAGLILSYHVVLGDPALDQ